MITWCYRMSSIYIWEEQRLLGRTHRMQLPITRIRDCSIFDYSRNKSTGEKSFLPRQLSWFRKNPAVQVLRQNLTRRYMAPSSLFALRDNSFCHLTMYCPTIPCLCSKTLQTASQTTDKIGEHFTTNRSQSQPVYFVKAPLTKISNIRQI